LRPLVQDFIYCWFRLAYSWYLRYIKTLMRVMAVDKNRKKQERFARFFMRKEEVSRMVPGKLFIVLAIFLIPAYPGVLLFL
jgi:hypothetical protein